MALFINPPRNYQQPNQGKGLYEAVPTPPDDDNFPSKKKSGKVAPKVAPKRSSPAKPKSIFRGPEYP